MDFVNYMRKLEGKPPVEKPKVRTTPDPAVQNVRSVSLEHCQRVLNGSVTVLDLAFGWYSTPQGGQYWCDRCEDGSLMSEEDYQFVRGVLEYWSNSEGTPDDGCIGDDGESYEW